MTMDFSQEKSEANILQGEKCILQSSNDKLYDEMYFEWSKGIPTESKLRNYVNLIKILKYQGTLCSVSTETNRPVTMHFFRVGTNVYMVG